MQEIHVAVPDSLLMEDRDLRDRTVKLGLVARALAIYRVERVYIFRDPIEGMPESEGRFIAEVLGYLETPQYLRKRLYPLKPELRYAGLMPPLKIPSHKKNPILTPGEFREGIVEITRGEKSVFVGTDSNLRFVGDARANSRVTVKIERNGSGYYARQVTRKEVKDYWGYVVRIEKNILQLCRSYGLSVITSRLGSKIEETWKEVKDLLHTSSETLLVFGAPRRGLLEMYGREQWLGVSRFILNTIPNQGVDTVRTEEALLATLQTFNLLAVMK
ncbi:MAG: putative RNA uridine N3 methyltransferase [Conexivisphaerales archaeon]